jgi:hypothetical protein
MALCVGLRQGGVAMTTANAFAQADILSAVVRQSLLK